MTLGKLFRAYRKRLNLTQTELADELGVSQGTISKWEKDQLTPVFNLGIRAVQFLDIPIQVVLGQVKEGK